MSLSFEAEQIIGELTAQLVVVKREHDEYRQTLEWIGNPDWSDDNPSTPPAMQFVREAREVLRVPCPIHDFASGFCLGYCAAQVAAQAIAKGALRDGPYRSRPE